LKAALSCGLMDGPARLARLPDVVKRGIAWSVIALRCGMDTAARHIDRSDARRVDLGQGVAIFGKI